MKPQYKRMNYLVECATNVQRPFFLATDRNSRLGNILALVEDPSSRPAGTVTVEFVGALLRIMQPVGKSPSLRFFLGIGERVVIDRNKFEPLPHSSRARNTRSIRLQEGQYRLEGLRRSGNHLLSTRHNEPNGLHTSSFCLRSSSRSYQCVFRSCSLATCCC